MDGQSPQHYLSQGLLLALVSAIVLSAVFIALPASATAHIGNNYSGKVIEVPQGGIFVLRTELEWQESEVPGYYGVTLVWEDNNRADENFTVLYTRVFIDNDNDNLPGPSPIWLENFTELLSGSGTSGTRWTFKIYNTTGDYNNGYFDVEIYMQAASRGTPHRAPWDNHSINKPGWGGSIDYAESNVGSTTPAVTTIKVLRGVDVTIDPKYQSGLSGATLNYTVTVWNMGGIEDNYDLTVSDNENWAPSVLPTSLTIPAGENRVAALSVVIPENAVPCTEDKIIITATSRTDNTVRDNDSCIAHATKRGVDVSISPDNQENLPGGNLSYTVTVKNTGTENDNYNLAVVDNENWGPTLGDYLLEVPGRENKQTTLTVTIPENLRTPLEDNITVTATSWDNTVKDNASCIAKSKIIRGAEVSISPAEKTGLRGWTLTYTVTVWNRGNIKDNFRLENKDNFYWPMVLENDRFDDMPPNENRTTTLRVTIRDNAAPAARDNVRVIAILVENENVRAENSCIAHLAQVTFTVSISPENQSRFRGENLTYIVTLRNTTTDNVDFQDNYSLTIGDNSGWPLSLPENRIENVGRDNENSKTFTVAIPDNATPYTRDSVTITATSQADNRENRSGSCIAHSLAVYVFISPPENSALPGDNLTYIVNVWSTSTSSENDNFTLTVSDNSGWGPTLSENVVKLSMGRVENVILSVMIPENAVPCTRDNITVTVISENDNTVKDNDSCIAHTGYAGVSVSISPIYNENFQGGNLIYYVTVKNTGTITDNFRLENLDNLGWSLMISPSSLTIPKEENRTATLRVTISWYFPPGTSDNITVRATSVENENVSAENSCIAHSKLFEERTYPTDDAHVRFAARGSNYSVDNLYVGMLEGSRARSFLRFKLPTVPVGWTVENALLYLYSWDLYYGENVQCHRVDNDDWSENTITWNTQPSIGDNLDGPKEVVFDPPPGPWLNSWDVTDFVRGQYQVDNTASLAMIGAGENIPPNHWVMFLSKENITYKPYLRILYRPSPDWVGISISPSYTYDYPGITENYQVTVKNIGWENNSYRLEDNDNSGWVLTLDNAWFDNVPPGENRVTTLRVKIPDNAAPGTEDRITVRVISVDNESIWDENSCTARSVLPTVSVSPSYDNAPRGENLTYTVTVTNLTTYSKSFNLTVQDNAGPYLSWNPKLDDHRFNNIPPGGSRTTKLKVTASWYSPPGTSDNITVRAENENIWAENSCIARSNPTEVTIYLTDDAYVLEKLPYNNYGLAPSLQVGRLENGAVRSFLKFNLPATLRGFTIENAQLYLYASGITGGGENVRCYRVDNDDWHENTITWNKAIENYPIGAVLDNRPVTESSTWYSWDVTSFVASELGGDSKASFCMVGAGENTPPDHSAVFERKAPGSRIQPYLKIVYRLGSRWVVVTISPNYQSWLRGGTENYQVTVKNVGWENSSYSLENLDNLGWSMSLDNVRFDNVPPGDNRPTTLWVTVPTDAAPCTEDNVIVKATSVEDNVITGSAGCVAHSLVVYISITPENQSALPGDNLTYMVKIWSTSTSPENDNFRLTVVDNENWDFSISPHENIPVSSVENGTATLTITVPENENIFARDNIAVTVFAQTDPAVKENASCIAQAGYMDFKFSISPKYQRAFPGETLTYAVTITNTGTVAENFELEIISDNENWVPSPRTLDFNNVAPGENKSPSLTVRVPSGAAHCTTSNITVRCRATVAQVARLRKVVYPSDDTYADEGTPNENHGDYPTLRVVPIGVTPTACIPWLKFDLSLPPASENIGVAKLWLNFTRDRVGKGAETGAYFSENDNWSESTLTWDNMPQLAPTPTDSIFLSTGWVSWEVTPDVTRELGGDNRASWYLKNEGAGSDYDMGTASSKENDNAALHPYLEIIGGRCVKYASDSCTAHATHLSISVKEISPRSSEGLPGGSIEFLITVKNEGLEKDSYHLKVVDDAGWENLKFDDNFLEDVPENKISQTSLRVIIPDSVTPGMRNNLKVIVTSGKDPNIENSDNCTVLVGSFTRGVRVSISPSYRENAPRRSVTFTVTVTNTGGVRDNFTLSVRDNENWSPSVSPSSLLLAAGASGSATLTVRIPDNATACTRDNIRVIARSIYDNAVENENSCIVHVISIRRGVRVEISPEENSAGPGGNVVFRVIVTNTGDVVDNYVLTKSDNAGWGPTLSESSLLNVENGASRTVTLTVTIPEDAESCTRDMITVTARSLTDNTIENRASCTAHAIVSGVEVTISPDEKTGLPGEDLTFTVTVKNTGEIEDSYDLTVIDDAGWGATLSENLLTIPVGENGAVFVSVTIPSDAVKDDFTIITVTATSRGDPTKSSGAACYATVGEEGRFPVLPLIVGAVAVGGGAVIALLLKKGIIHLPSLRLHSRRQILRML